MQHGQPGQHHHDPDYHQWREEQIRNLDNDYQSWRQDRYRKFSDEFNTWRASRSGGQGQNTVQGTTTGGNFGPTGGATGSHQGTGASGAGSSGGGSGSDLRGSSGMGSSGSTMSGADTSSTRQRRLRHVRVGEQQHHRVVRQEMKSGEMSMNRFKLSACALALAFSFGGALAQYSSPAQSSGTGGAGTSATGGRSAPAAQPGTGTRNAESKKDDKVARGDRKFIQEAAGSGMFEVQAAQLATRQASDPNVKSFAGMLVDQHTKANDELVKLANAKQVELPAAPPRAMRREIEKLGKKQGGEFDRDFVREVGIKAHEKDIKTFEKASKDTKDPELKAFIDKTLPTLKEHLAMAQKLPQAGKQGGEQMGRAGSGDSSSRMGAPGSTPAGGSTGTGGGSGANKTGS